MSSKSNRQKTVADDAVRASKLLDRNKPQPVGASDPPALRLTQNKQLGEFSVVLFVTPLGTQSYTVCHPIGITDLDANDWVLLPSEQIPAALARAQDPRRGELEKERSGYRNTALVAEGLLQEKEIDGVRTFFYPSDNATPRNAILDTARAESKAEVKALRRELNELPARGAGAARQELNARIQMANKVDQYLEEPFRSEEAAIRSRLKTLGPEVEARHPSTHRTLVGPYGDQPQRHIHGTQGFSLLDVNAALQKSMISGKKVIQNLPDVPSGKQGSSGNRARNALGAAVRALSPGSGASKR